MSSNEKREKGREKGPQNWDHTLDFLEIALLSLPQSFSCPGQVSYRLSAAFTTLDRQIRGFLLDFILFFRVARSIGKEERGRVSAPFAFGQNEMASLRALTGTCSVTKPIPTLLIDLGVREPSI